MADETPTADPVMSPAPVAPVAPTPLPAVSKTTGDKREYVVTVKETSGLKVPSQNILATDTEDAWDHFCQLNGVTGAGLTRIITEIKS